MEADPAADPITKLLPQVLELPAEEREAFLAKACPDESIAEEIRHRIEQWEANTHSMDVSPTEPVKVEDLTAKTSAPLPSGDEAAPRIPDYEMIEALGRGGMGLVYKARHLKTDRLVALKIIRPDRIEHLTDSDREQAIDRFRNEALAAAKLDHDNIVTVYDVGDAEDVQYYAMRLVDGESLADKVRQGPLDSRTAATYMEAAARGLHEAHQSGVLHRDIKPHNIMIERRQDRALIADFGLAKLREGGHTATLSGEVFGSPPYMSPEQAIDAGAVTVVSDVYGLGATLYHLLTGRPPFQGANPVKTLKQVIEQEPAAPREINADVDPNIETICLKCLAKERSRRYQDAKELADDLRRYLNDEPILAKPVGRIERLRKFARRNRAVVTAGGVAFLVLIVGLIGTSLALGWALDEKAKREQVNLSTLEQAGDLAYQRGQWQTALNSYESATAGYDEPPQTLRIKRARTLIAMQQSQEAQQEMQRLLDEASGNPSGNVLLAAAEAEAADFKSTDKGAAYYRQALQTQDLSPADEAYAQAVLSVDLNQAILLAEKAIELDPFRKDAQDFLITLYALNGQTTKLRTKLVALKHMYPEDPGYVLIEAVLATLDGHLDKAIQDVDTLREAIGDERLRSMKRQLKILDTFTAMLAGAATGQLETSETPAALAQLNELVGLIDGTNVVSLAPLSNATTYPVMQPMIEAAPSIYVKMASGYPVTAHQEFETLCRSYPMHELLMVHALLKFNRSFEEGVSRREALLACQASALRAIKTPKIVSRIPPVAHTALAGAHSELFFGNLLEGEELRRAKDACRDNLITLLQMASDPNDRWNDWIRNQLWMLVTTATVAEQNDLARSFVDLWMEDEPNSAEALSWMALIEKRDGNLVSAIEWADKALAIDPQKDRALKARSAARKLLQEKVSELKLDAE